ncbi:hypothetical protein ACVJBD_000367 [Rhizobium mongolense]
MGTVRFVTTHDFFGSFARVATSYGHLPGGHGLADAVRSLRDPSTIWIDSGDFSQGGALCLPTRGVGGFCAANELGFDVSVVGNHDLDFGLPVLIEHAAKLNFPVLCANMDLGLPATTLLSTPEADIGVIGLTHHNLASMSSWTVAPDRKMPGKDKEKAFSVTKAAEELRRAGASVVVCVCHDGVDWHFAENRYVADPERFSARCADWCESVDLIVAGHTLGRFFGEIRGTPVVQPWPLGSELAIVDVDVSSAGVHCRATSQLVPPGPQWRGFGSDVIRGASDDVLGYLEEPLLAKSHGPAPLASFLAKAVLEVCDADASFAYTTCAQPTIDGIFAYLGQGEVTFLQLLHIVPYSDLGIVTAEISEAEHALLQQLVRPRPQDRTMAWGGALSGGIEHPITLRWQRLQGVQQTRSVSCWDVVSTGPATPRI